MTVSMAEHQLRFWQELFSPFPDELLSVTKRGGEEFTYVNKRAIANRLDSLCGPNGWYPEYEATARGYKCRLYILCPTIAQSEWVWCHKEDGAGFEEMGSFKKVWNDLTRKMEKTDEFESDVDNDEKSGYTNAFRRAAQDAWGIGRYLYGKGIPSWCNPNAVPVEHTYCESFRAPAATAAQTRNAAVPSAQIETRPEAPKATPAPSSPAPTTAKPADPERSAQPSPTTSNGASAPASTAAGGASCEARGNFIIPKPGKTVWQWAMEMEKTFETKITAGMAGYGEGKGYGRTFATWKADQVKECCLDAIRHIRELPTYKGQFEYLFKGPGAEPVQAHEPTQSPSNSGVNIAELRKNLMTKIDALIFAQTGAAATTPNRKSAFETIAAASENHEGHTGEVPDNLKDMTDITWLRNMHALADQQIKEAMALPPDEEIPF